MEYISGRLKNTLETDDINLVYEKWPIKTDCKDYRGERYGELTILYRTLNSGNKSCVVCQCSCGRYKKVQYNHLREGSTKSCGHLTYNDLTGKKVGQLTVLEPTPLKGTGGEIKWKCQCSCGNITYVTTGHLLRWETISCGCAKSSGCVKIATILEDSKIQYLREYKIKDCKDKVPLPFDFALFNNKQELLCLIECDGLQHYKKVDYFGGDDYYQYVKKHDNIKNEYCKKNNIPLLRIIYTNDTKQIDIFYLIKRFFKQNNLTKEKFYGN